MCEELKNKNGFYEKKDKNGQVMILVTDNINFAYKNPQHNVGVFTLSGAEFESIMKDWLKYNHGVRMELPQKVTEDESYQYLTRALIDSKEHSQVLFERLFSQATGIRLALEALEGGNEKAIEQAKTFLKNELEIQPPLMSDGLTNEEPPEIDA